MKKINNVDEYIASAPEALQTRLHQIRKAIKDSASGVSEKLSYGMPYYGYNGRLAYFAYTKEHVGLYIPPPIIRDHEKELKGYSTSTATIRFPHTKKLPMVLIKKLVKARVKHNQKAIK